MIDIDVHKVGSRYTHSSSFHLIRENGSGDWLALIFLSKAQIFLQDNWHTVNPNTFMIYPKDMKQEYKAFDRSFCNDWFHFTINNKDFFNKLSIPVAEPIPLCHTEDLSRIVQIMASEQLLARKNVKEILDCYAKSFFYTACDIFHNPNPAQALTYYAVFSDLRAEIYSNPAHNWTVDEMAHMTSLGKDRFQHLYKEYFGISCINDVIKARIEYAKYLLSSTNLPIWKISQQCGYRSDVHFMRQFKKKTGITPSEYRL